MGNKSRGISYGYVFKIYFMSCLVIYYYRAVFWDRVFQYLILVLITTDPGLRLSRMTTITNYPSSRSRIVAHTARRHPVGFLYGVY